ncbi:uncharacterized protein METZ01_LOCUS241262, partial [marine metagenome]
YTRNGSFVLDEQFSVINSSGQALLAAAVDSSGKADLSKLNKLQIPTTTAGEALQTSLVQLSLNLPSDADVINAEFNRNNPSTYNKSTALSVYDSGGNSYLATVYYVKTSNATADSPFNKWQTYVYVGDDQVNAALQQSTDENDELLFVNKYGELKPFSQVEDLLVNRKTQKFALDDLTDVRTSVPASVSGSKVPNDMTADQGFDFGAFAKSSSGTYSATELKTFFTVDVDSSGVPVTVDLSGLHGAGKVTGVELADYIQDQLNRSFGDERYFDLSTVANQKFSLTLDGGTAKDIDLASITGQSDVSNVNAVKIEDIVEELNTKLAASPAMAATAAYDYALRCFTITPTNASHAITILGGTAASPATNALFGLGVTALTLGADATWGTTVAPNGTLIRPATQQRYGITVAYDGAQETFSISSGSTGDQSEIGINFTIGSGSGATKTDFANFMGFEATSATDSVYTV